MREPSDADIRRYLLGMAPEPDMEALEEAYFSRPQVLDRIRALEDDLLDDYAAGRLDPADRAVFEARYLASEPLRRRVEGARALRMAAPGASRLAGAPAALRPRTRWTGLLAIAAGVVVALLASWLWRSRGPGTGAPVPPTSVAGVETPTPGPTVAPSPSPHPAPTPTAPATTRLAFALSPVLLRGEGGPTQLRLPAHLDTVVLELQGDPAMVPGASPLEGALETVEGRRVWSGPARRDGRRGLVASVAVPADRLAPADYLATLSAGGQTVYRYFFRVSAR